MLTIRRKIRQASLFPAISLQAGITTRYLGGNGDHGDPAQAYPLFSQLSDNRFRQVAIAIQVPLFDRNRNRLDIKLAEIEREKAEDDISRTRESLRVELQILREDIRSLYSAIRSAEIMTQAYAMSYETAVEKYRSGILDLYSLHLAKNNHTNAQLELTRYIMEYSMNAALLSLYERFTKDP